MKELITNKVPILLIGAPGVGKTSIIKQLFDHTEIILTSAMVEEDIAGLPYREGDYDYRTTPALFRRLKEADSQGKTTCLFLDELDKARRSVADTLLTLVASRRIGNAALPESTCIVAAGNPPEFGGGDGISDAMQSRFSVIEFIPSVTNWSKWARKEFKTQPVLNIINNIEKGIIPIIEAVGEGFEKRISSPRTITFALNFLEQNGHDENFEIISKGLLTANVSSLIISFSKNIGNETLEKSISTKIKANKLNKSTAPLVI